MILSIKVRLLPTPEQETKLWHHVGAARWMYNYMLAEQKRRYAAGQKHMSSFEMNKLITTLKKQEEYAWLTAISNPTLQRSCADLARAYDNFFSKRANAPCFKSKRKSKPSFPTGQGDNAPWYDGTLFHIQKIGKIRCQSSYTIPTGRGHKFSNPRIAYTPNGKWILTLGIKYEKQEPSLTDAPMGIDLGIKELATVAFGGEQIQIHNVNYSHTVRRLERRLAHLQRVVARKYLQNGSYVKTKNTMKAEQKVRLAQYHLANIRQDWRHKTTHHLTSLLPSSVVMENLNVSGMMRNHHLSKSIAQEGFFEFTRQMQYKCNRNNIPFMQVDRFFPSSKTCSRCGYHKTNLKLHERSFVCANCGLVLDRDYNAAINLMQQAV